MVTNTKALVVDDESRMRDSIKALLEGHSFTIYTADSVNSAMEMLDQVAFDVIISDIFMKEDDGFSLMEHTKKNHPDIPMVFMTGNASMDTAITALRMGAFDYHIKPLEPELLVKSVQNAVEQKRLKDMNRDITGRLAQSEKRYRLLVNNSPDMIYSLDLDGNIVFVNNTCETLLGYKRHHLVGKPYALIVKNDGDSLPTDFYMHNRTMELLKVNGSGCVVETTVSIIEDSDGRPIGCYCIDRNISIRKQLEYDLMKSSETIRKTEISSMVALAKLAEQRDQGTGRHLERIRDYTFLIALALSENPKYQAVLTREAVNNMANSSVLHDIGKVGIPDSILLKPGRLTPQEFEIIKQHPRIGGDSIREVERNVPDSFLVSGREIAYYHHERWDGRGYPYGFQGTEIPLSARIVAVADVYDALTSERPYKKAFPHEEARELIIGDREMAFDPDVVDAFLQMEDRFLQINEEKRVEPGETMMADLISETHGHRNGFR